MIEREPESPQNAAAPEMRLTEEQLRPLLANPGEGMSSDPQEIPLWMHTDPDTPEPEARPPWWDAVHQRWEDPQTHKSRFDEMAATFRQGELTRRNEDGTRTTVVSYERHIDPLSRHDVAWVSEFRLRAAAAGLREAFSPLVLPTQPFLYPSRTALESDPHSGQRGLTFVQLGYEKPAERHPGVYPPAGTAPAGKP
jgi:hypothetical protein